MKRAMLILTMVLISSFCSFAIDLISPGEGEVFAKEPLLAWSANASLFNLTIYGDSFSYNRTNLNTSNHTPQANMSDGWYSWFVVSGNTSSSTYNFTINSTPLMIDKIAPSGIQNNITALIELSTSYNSSCRLGTSNPNVTEESFISKSPMNITGSRNHSDTVALFDEGINSFYIVCNSSLNGLFGGLSINISRDLDPPVIDDVDYTDLDINSEEDLDMTLTVSDVSNVTALIRYKLWNQSYGGWKSMNPDSEKVFTYTIPYSNWSEHPREEVSWQLNVSDSFKRVVLANYSETIDPSMTRPQISIPSSLMAEQGKTLSFNISVDDEDGDTIQFGCNDSRPSINKVNDSLAVVNWNPSNNDIGVNDFTFYIYDGVFNETREVRITVNNVNDPPSFSREGPVSYSGYVYNIFNCSFNASDPDAGDNLSFATDSGHFPISSSGEIRAFPTMEMKGSHELNVTVTDSYGGLDWIVANIEIMYCGDNKCSQGYESCQSCSEDCGACGDDESAALQIPVRNCLNQSMVMQTLRLVPRATCQTKGKIVDGMEICGNLSEQELVIDKVVNNSYEKIETLVTDENGRASFTPAEEGDYRITLTSQDVEKRFTAKECREERTDVPKTKKEEEKERDPRITSSVERPDEVVVDEQQMPLLVVLMIYLVIPILCLLLAGVGARYVYGLEVKKIRKGSKDSSSYVDFIDRRVLAYWYRVSKKLFGWLPKRKRGGLRQNFESFFEGYWLKIYEKLVSFLPKSRIMEVPYYHVSGSKKAEAEAVGVSVGQFLLKKSAGELLPIMRHLGDASLIQLSISLKKAGLKVSYSNTSSYYHGHPEVDQLKELMKNKGKYEKKQHDIQDLKKYISRKSIPVIEIIAKDPDRDAMEKSILPVVGFDGNNIVVHDARLQANRRIKSELLEVAWKNADYSVAFVRK